MRFSQIDAVLGLRTDDADLKGLPRSHDIIHLPVVEQRLLPPRCPGLHPCNFAVFAIETILVNSVLQRTGGAAEHSIG